MNPMIGRCPVCSNALTVTRLQCGNCSTGIEGSFALGRLQALTVEQIQFVETFIKNRGKIKDVEAELGVSYPTVVSRLNEVVRSMGYEIDESTLSEVDQFEYYQARIINPQGTPDMHGAPIGPGSPIMPPRPVAPVMPTPPVPPVPPTRPLKVGPDKRQQILDDLAAGKISAADAMKQLQG